MIIGGLRKVSLIDYPGEVSTVVFTRGCNFRCIYCHNSHLVLPELFSAEIPEKQMLDYLRSRAGKITAAVISGGEPTIYSDLPDFVWKIREFGLKVKVDTNGTNPEMIKKLIEAELIDFIALDIKAPFEMYKTISGVEVSVSKIIESIKILKQSSIRREFRTTILKGIHTRSDIDIIKGIIGDDQLTLHSYRHTKSVLNNKLNRSFELSDAELQSFLSVKKG